MKNESQSLFFLKHSLLRVFAGKRNFLFLLFSYSFIFAACGKDSGSDAPVTPPSPPAAKEDVTMYVTTASRSYDLNKQTVAFNPKTSMSPSTITLVPTVTYQGMDGFGVAITGSTCFNLMEMKSADRTAFLTETFSEDKGYGFSYVRISIGCSDFSLSEYTCCDETGIEHFALQSEEKNYVIPILKEILAINPSLKIMGSPWTCPRWMKVNNLTEKKPYNLWTGGQLNPDYYQDYATYFVKWIQAFAKEGINIYSITSQNEPLNAGNSASLYMEWGEQKDFVKTALGPQMKAAGLDTKIYAWDHNYDGYAYALNIYGSDKVASDYFTGAAFHNYNGSSNVLNTVHQQYPDKELIFTEASIGEWNAGRDLNKRLLADMEELAFGAVGGWCKGVIVWNLMLDSDRGPNRGDYGGCPTCYGAVDINNSDYKTITRNSHYYMIAHLSSVVKPGAVRIGTTGYESGDVAYMAFKNTDGSHAFIIINKQDAEKTVIVNDGKHNYDCKLPAKSVVSCLWK